MGVGAFNHWLVNLPRSVKRGVMLTADGVTLPLLMYLAFALRLGDPTPYLSSYLLVWLAPLVALPVLYMAGFYRAVVRFIGTEMAWTILGCVTLIALTLAAAPFMTGTVSVPRSVVIIFWAFSLLYLGGSRFLVRRYLVWSVREQAGRVPVAIFGAGECGVQLASALLQASVYLPRFFVDDKAALHGLVIQGVRVIGRGELAHALHRHDIETVLLAIPSVSRRQRLEVVAFLESLGVQVKVVPALPDVVAGLARIEDVHDLDIEDLLGRESVPPDTNLLRMSITGYCVMVTGAGGSIGSELCRQILAQKPARLVLLDRGEFHLYAIEQELRKWLQHDQELKTEIVAVLGSAVSREQVERICQSNGVNTLFHAAAYKHVPIVEANPAAGVKNNVFGTLHTALAAEAAGVERFVLVSTDKAVRPTSAMGASKRFAEAILQALADRGSPTVFSMVRFGNVLGSSGSVVPLFRKQILAGGPVTVTHPDVTRYFMTIQEAAQLVIQAGAMAQGGEVFVLDMGEPVRIHDLAYSMVQLMGFSIRDADAPEGDIEISVTGLRPGEKLHEELLIGSNATGTQHPMVMWAHERRLAWAEVAAIIGQLESALNEDDTLALMALLRQHVSGYYQSEGQVAKLVPIRASGEATLDGGTYQAS